MYDPDLYSTDPLRRDAARANLPPPSSSQPVYSPPSTSSGTSTPSYFPSYTSPVTSLPTSMRWVDLPYENLQAHQERLRIEKERKPPTIKIGRKTGIACAVFLACAIGYIGVELKKAINYPAISVAFNDIGIVSVARDPSVVNAYQESLSKCRPTLVGYCKTGITTEAGVPTCLHFRVATSGSHNSRFSYYLTSERPATVRSGYRSICNF